MWEIELSKACRPTDAAHCGRVQCLCLSCSGCPEVDARGRPLFDVPLQHRCRPALSSTFSVFYQCSFLDRARENRRETRAGTNVFKFISTGLFFFFIQWRRRFKTQASLVDKTARGCDRTCQSSGGAALDATSHVFSPHDRMSSMGGK